MLFASLSLYFSPLAAKGFVSISSTGELHLLANSTGCGPAVLVSAGDLESEHKIARLHPYRCGTGGYWGNQSSSANFLQHTLVARLRCASFKVLSTCWKPITLPTVCNVFVVDGVTGAVSCLLPSAKGERFSWLSCNCPALLLSRCLRAFMVLSCTTPSGPAIMGRDDCVCRQAVHDDPPAKRRFFLRSPQVTKVRSAEMCRSSAFCIFKPSHLYCYCCVSQGLSSTSPIGCGKPNWDHGGEHIQTFDKLTSQLALLTVVPGNN